MMKLLAILLLLVGIYLGYFQDQWYWATAMILLGCLYFGYRAAVTTGDYVESAKKE